MLGWALAVAVAAQERPLATHVTWEAAWEAEAPVRLPIADEPTRVTLTLPALSARRGQRLCLRFQARLHTDHPAGWNNYLALLCNDTPVAGTLKERRPRVLNRRLVFATSHPHYPEVPLLQERDGWPCFQVFFGPPEPELDERILTDGEEGYWYLLDFTDLAQATAENRLTFINTARREFWGGTPPAGMELILEGLAMGWVPEGEVRALQEVHFIHREALEGPDLKGPGATVRLLAGGGLQIEREGEIYFVESTFSFPREGTRGENKLLCRPEAEGEKGWQPKIRREGERLRTQAEGRWYRLERQVQWNKGRMEIADALTNRTDEVLGVAATHQIITPEPPERVWLNGLEEMAHGAGRFPENPTVFVAQGKTGLGAVAEDDAMRLQMGTRAMENQVAFRTERLGLSPGETYVLRWALYPGSPDYFDFINALRRDWDVNYPVLGPFDFFDVRPLQTPEGRERAKELLARKRLKLFALVPWFEYYNGWPYSRDEYRALMAEGMRFLREVVPEARCLACVETNLVPVPLSFFGDTIPKEGWPIGRENGGQYGQAATPAMTARIDASPWRDSCIRDAEGNARLDCWYVQHYQDKPALNLMVYPEVGNYRHGHALEQLAWLLEEVGFDGVYIDQFSMAYNVGVDRYTCERWDGRTVTLDAGGRVVEKVADLGLVSAPARREWVEFVLSQGKIVVCNSHPVVEALQSLRTFRFMETQGYDPLGGEGPPYQWTLAKGQLHSPIGLGHSFPGSAGADFFVRTVIAHLRFGLLYYCYSTDFPPDGERGGEYGPINEMFPFTPRELHEGWVLGEERLITCVSGEFPWPHEREPKVLQFDRRGRERPAEAAVKREGEGYRVTIKLRDWWEIAVVE